MHTMAPIPIARQSSRGFTLLELMAAITVGGILLGIGIPAFNETIRNNRTAAQTNELITSLSLARSEATKRGMPVSVCAAKTATKCQEGTVKNWSLGWLVFTDRIDTPGSIDAAVPAADGDQILQSPRAVTNGMQVTTNSISFVRYGANGGLINPSGSTLPVFGIEHEQCTGEHARTITLSRTGQASLDSKVPCT